MVDCWMLGHTHGLVPHAPTCPLYVSATRPALLKSHSSAFHHIINYCAPLTATLHTVLLHRYREELLSFRKEDATDRRVQITNVLVRFIWVIYIPTRGPSLALRTWIAALLEVLRRCQWNVCTSSLVCFTL
jgi:hypothetical protein